MSLENVINESKSVIDKYLMYRKYLNNSGTTHMLAIATVAFYKIQNAGNFKIKVMDLWIDSFMEFPEFINMLEAKFRDAIDNEKLEN